jgi:hypothetical protein
VRSPFRKIFVESEKSYSLSLSTYKQSPSWAWRCTINILCALAKDLSKLMSMKSSQIFIENNVHEIKFPRKELVTKCIWREMKKFL